MFLSSHRRPGCPVFRPLESLLHLFTLFALTFIFTPPCHAASVTLAWDPPTSSNATGYNLYRGNVSGQYTVITNVGSQTTRQVDDLVAGTTYYFAVTAYNAYGESGYSNEYVYTPPAAAINRAPTAGDGTLIVMEDTPKSGMLSATDPDGDSLALEIIGPPANGRISSFNTSTGAFTYIPNKDVNANDSFTFRVSDGSLSAVGTISITISAVNDAPVAVADTATTFKSRSVTIGVLANDMDVDGDRLSLVSAGSGSHGSTSVSGTSVVYTPNPGITVIQPFTVDSFTYQVSDGKGGTATGTVTVNIYADSSDDGGSRQVVMAINAGGGQFTAADGIVYQADACYSGGATLSTGNAISNTGDDALYQTRRYGSFSYELPVENGSYVLALKFAEIYFSSAGERVFDVFVEGQEVVDRLDIVAGAGSAFRAHDITVPVTVRDGAVTITFGSITRSPQINAILLSKDVQPTLRGVNSGGDRFAAFNGQEYEPDGGFSGGRTYTATASISGTLDDTLYRSERYGDFTYSIPVVDGEYLVTLRFAEIYWDRSGKRAFDVWIEGVQVISELDLFAKVGRYAAYDHEERVCVTDGELNISFHTVKDNAKVSAILVEPAY